MKLFSTSRTTPGSTVPATPGAGLAAGAGAVLRTISLIALASLGLAVVLTTLQPVLFIGLMMLLLAISPFLVLLAFIVLGDWSSEPDREAGRPVVAAASQPGLRPASDGS